MFTTKHTDIIIVGAGGAGLTAGLLAAQRGLSVTILSKVPPAQSHTVAAQGGINAALGNKAADDWRWHFYDTVKGSDFLADQDAAAMLCEQAASAIYWLESLGMPFSRDEKGQIYQRIYGGQSSEFGKGAPPPRACAVADRTGHSLIHTLYQQSLKHGVTVHQPFVAVDLIRDPQDGRVLGVFGVDVECGQWVMWRAHSVILATGGYGQAYATTTASSICTGDGGGMVLRAGLPLKDMEFVQFHPTGLYPQGFLITEAARAEGGMLLNAKGERFMERYAPRSIDLAARDVIARAIAQEIREGRGAGEQGTHVLLSLSHLSSEILEQRLPTVLETSRHFARIDARKTPIPVAPTVHYTMGGIPTNCSLQALDAAGNPVPGLYAIGEAACVSVHGANRLGCNALLDLVVFGKEAGEHLARHSGRGAHSTAPIASLVEASLSRIENYFSAPSDAPSPVTLRRIMQNVMERCGGVVREEASLQAGIAELESLCSSMRRMRVGARSLLWNDQLREAFELENLLPQALVTLHAALARTESRGSHYRLDFSERDDANWCCHSMVWLDDSFFVNRSTLPIRLLSDDMEVSTVIPVNRSY